jgi:hypothetical protein
MSSMQRPVYEEGDHSVVELIKSYLGPERSPKQYRPLVVSGIDLDNEHRGTRVKCKGLHRCMCFGGETSLGGIPPRTTVLNGKI